MSNAPNAQESINAAIGFDEELITLTEATRCLPKVDGKKPAVSTIWRWCRKGLRGVYLDYVRVGRKVCTSRKALLRFFTDLSEIEERTRSGHLANPVSLKRFPRNPITSRQRLRALAKADAVLEQAGI